MRAIGLCSAALAGLAASAAAEGEFVPETLTIEERIAPGPNVFVLDQAWSGPSRINVLGAADFAMKGNLTPGTTTQMALSADGRTLYTASVYMKRMVYGPLEAVVHEFDVDTLGIKREIAISEKLAQVESQPGLLALSADEAYLLAQNATPATSVSVVDLAAGKQIAEIPIPGCWTIEPATTGRKFTTLCGDGKLRSYTFEPDGSFSEPAASAPIFDADKDALFSNAVRYEGDLLFASFKGDIYRVSDAEAAPKLVEIIPVAAGVEGAWAPGGSEVIAVSPAHGVAFLLMHSGAEDGSHKNGAEEIWAFDLAAKKLLYRSVANAENSITVTRGESPVIYATSAETNVLHRYEVDPEAKFAAKHVSAGEGFGSFLAYVVAQE